MTHTISEKDLDAFLDEERWDTAACSYGKGESKRFEVNRSGVLRVTNHSKAIYRGLDKKAAIDAYNTAT